MSNVPANEQRNVIYLYGAVWAAIIMSCVPSISYAVAAVMLFITILIAAYVMRSKTEGFNRNHTTYVIRSLWFGIFILPALTLTAAIAYLIPNYDPTAVATCVPPIYDHILANPGNIDMKLLYDFMIPCMPEFMTKNGQTLTISGLIATLPVLAYLIYRFAKGTFLSMKGKEINKPKNWII